MALDETVENCVNLICGNTTWRYRQKGSHIARLTVFGLKFHVICSAILLEMANTVHSFWASELRVYFHTVSGDVESQFIKVFIVY